MGVIRQPDSEIVKGFLNRKLDNFDWIKEVGDEELDQRIQALDPRPLLTTPLFKHQKVMFLIGIKNPDFLFFADLGLGKTFTSLSLISYLKQIGRIKKTLVLVPNLVLIQSWLDECTKHTPSLKGIAVHGKKHERFQQLNTNSDLYILNYAGLQVILSSTTGKRNVDGHDVEEFASQFDCIIYDEITAVKNIQSLTYKICNRLSAVIPYRYGLTGRPFGRHLEDLWAQFHVIDRGKTLGTNFYFFRNCYFKASNRPWGIDWKFNNKLTDNLHDQLKNRSIRYKLEDASLVPTRIVYRTNFPTETITYFNVEEKALKTSAIAGKSDEIRASFIKMREISSGFVNFIEKKGDEKIQHQIEFADNPKLELLIEKIQEIPDGCKAIIFHDFTYSGEVITKALKKLKIEHRWVYGGTPNKKKIQYIQEFKLNPDVGILILNAASGALGLNLQVANFCFFYESPVDPMTRDQAEARIIRTGQTKPTFIIDLVIINSKDEDILGFIKEGRNLLQELIENRGISD